jgi:hypothetical protein
MTLIGEDLPLNESDFLTEEEKVLAEKNKEKEKLDRIIKVAKERVEKYFEDPLHHHLPHLSMPFHKCLFALKLL